MRIINQPFGGQLGNIIIDYLNSGEYNKLTFVVAFAKNTGVLRLRETFERFKNDGGTIDALVGIDLMGTSYEALTNLRCCTNNLHIIHFESSQTFHPKVYFLEGPLKSKLIIGSNNMTSGGLWTNCETALEVENNNQDVESIRQQVQNYLNEIQSVEQSCIAIENQEQLDMLKDNGYIPSEDLESVRKIILDRTDRQLEKGKLFARGVSARLPRQHLSSSKEQTIPATVEHEINDDETSLCILPSVFSTWWICSGRMTGGSTNILDLSKKSLVEKGSEILTETPFYMGSDEYMLGSVVFFGLNPLNVGENKEIILNFDGEDYYGNTILYPTGESANGTWRLQIKGVSRSNNKITDAIRRKGVAFLANKILSFTKISEGYFTLSVFAENMLEEFKEASCILARNGNNIRAKQIGIIQKC